MEEKKKLVFGNNEFVAELWPGNDLNAPAVELEIDAFHTHYDRDYSTETPITGRYDLSVDEAKKLHAFLEEVIVPVEYEYNIERTSLEHGTSHLQYHIWFPKEDAEYDLSGYIEAEEVHAAEHGYRYATYRLVKRRKAGEVEVA